MTSNPPEWAESGPAESGPLDALPPGEDGFPASSGRWHEGQQPVWRTGQQPAWPGGAQALWQGAPQDDRWQAGPSRWPATRQPWPAPAADPAGPEPGTGQQARAAAQPPGDAADPGDEHLAALSYLSVPFLGPLVPLAIYLSKRRASDFVRRHSVQALNLSITALLYGICALILAGMLALDSLYVALAVGVPLAVALWLLTLSYAIRAGARASRGADDQIPAWLCACIMR